MELALTVAIILFLIVCAFAILSTLWLTYKMQQTIETLGDDFSEDFANETSLP